MGRRYKLDTKAMADRIRRRTAEIRIGKVYFLSSFNDVDGAMVKVVSKSTKINRSGWPSSVEYEVVSLVGTGSDGYYTRNPRGTCNATNLYDRIEDASPEAKARRRA